ncbi:peptidoglycan-binding domain-containing protein [Streptomyces sp. NPDC055287]
MVSDICTHTTARPTIKRGSSGAAVKQAQCYLNSSLATENLVIDGDFGPLTDAAVRKFQGCAEITVDGLCGAQTWSHLTFWANSPEFVC